MMQDEIELRDVALRAHGGYSANIHINEFLAGSVVMRKDAIAPEYYWQDESAADDLECWAWSQHGESFASILPGLIESAA